MAATYCRPLSFHSRWICIRLLSVPRKLTEFKSASKKLKFKSKKASVPNILVKSLSFPHSSMPRSKRSPKKLFTTQWTKLKKEKKSHEAVLERNVFCWYKYPIFSISACFWKSMLSTCLPPPSSSLLTRFNSTMQTIFSWIRLPSKSHHSAFVPLLLARTEKVGELTP